mgnify:CR=1 FL=1
MTMLAPNTYFPVGTIQIVTTTQPAGQIPLPILFDEGFVETLVLAFGTWIIKWEADRVG